MFSYIISDKNCVLGNRNTEYLLIEWKGRTGTYTWLGVMIYGPSAAKSLLHSLRVAVLTPDGETKARERLCKPYTNRVPSL